MKYLAILAFVALSSLFVTGANAQTLVQQLQAHVNYDIAYLNHHPCTACYTNYHLGRTQQQLTAAIAAQNAGTPLPPRMAWRGGVFGIAPLQPSYYATPTGDGGSSSTVTQPGTSSGLTGQNSR